MNIYPYHQKDKIINSEIKECMGCSGKGPFTKEHVIPQWLQKYLNIEHEIVAPIMLDNKHDQILKSRGGTPLKSFYRKKICAKCNNGWMSQLENAVTPLLSTLVTGKKALDALTTEERYIFSKWSLKTIFMLNAASAYYNIIPIEHFRSLRKNIIPAFVHTYAKQLTCREKFGWCESGAWADISESGQPPSSIDTLGSYKVILQLGKLFISVAYWPNEQYRQSYLEDWQELIYASDMACSDNTIVNYDPPVSNIDLLRRASFAIMVIRTE